MLRPFSIWTKMNEAKSNSLDTKTRCVFICFWLDRLFFLSCQKNLENWGNGHTDVIRVFSSLCLLSYLNSVSVFLMSVRPLLSLTCLFCRLLSVAAQHSWLARKCSHVAGICWGRWAGCDCDTHTNTKKRYKTADALCWETGQIYWLYKVNYSQLLSSIVLLISGALNLSANG